MTVAVFIELFPKIVSFQRGIQLIHSSLRSQSTAFESARQVAVFDQQPHPENCGGLPLMPVQKLELRDLQYCYESREGRRLALDLSDTALSARAGDTIVVTGPSGSGKSTLLRLLQRSIDPNRGHVTMNDGDAKSYNVESLCEHVALLTNNEAFYRHLVTDAIKVVHPEASDRAVRKACEDAALSDTVDQLKHGLDTHIGPGGATLSTGEKQRINIARLHLCDRSVLLLDEVTSGMDCALEREVLSGIRTRFPSCIMFIASHRLEIIKLADRIVSLDEQPGMVGTHDELTEHKAYSNKFAGRD